MPNLETLEAFGEDGSVRAVVETPRGSEAKINYDPETETFALSKALILGLRYPFDWGFIPSTKAEDGDPIDVLILHEAVTYPGVIVPCDLVGVLELLQHEGKKRTRNDRLFAIPRGARRQDALADARKLPKTMRDELERFFVATAAKDDKRIELLGWKGPAEAKRRLADARRRFQKQR